MTMVFGLSLEEIERVIDTVFGEDHPRFILLYWMFIKNVKSFLSIIEPPFVHVKRIRRQ